MNVIKEGEAFLESVTRYALSYQHEFAREDYASLKRLVEENPLHVELAALLARAAFAMAVSEDLSIAGNYMEDLETLRKRHSASYEIALTELNALFYITMGLRLLCDSNRVIMPAVEVLCNEFFTLAEPHSGNAEVAKMIADMRGKS